MKNLKKENVALKSYIETLKKDREILMKKVEKYELQKIIATNGRSIGDEAEL